MLVNFSCYTQLRPAPHLQVIGMPKFETHMHGCDPTMNPTVLKTLELLVQCFVNRGFGFGGDSGDLMGPRFQGEVSGLLVPAGRDPA